MKLDNFALHEITHLMNCARIKAELFKKSGDEADGRVMAAYFSGLYSFALVFGLNRGKIWNYVQGNYVRHIVDISVEDFMAEFGDKEVR